MKLSPCGPADSRKIQIRNISFTGRKLLFSCLWSARCCEVGTFCHWCFFPESAPSLEPIRRQTTFSVHRLSVFNGFKQLDSPVAAPTTLLLMLFKPGAQFSESRESQSFCCGRSVCNALTLCFTSESPDVVDAADLNGSKQQQRVVYRRIYEGSLSPACVLTHKCPNTESSSQ